MRTDFAVSICQDWAHHFLEMKSLVVATGLFAISYKLIFYSSDVKQYSSDVAIALALCTLTLHIQTAGLNVARSLAFGMIGGHQHWVLISCNFRSGRSLERSCLYASHAEKSGQNFIPLMKIGLFLGS